LNPIVTIGRAVVRARRAERSYVRVPVDTLDALLRQFTEREAALRVVAAQAARANGGRRPTRRAA